MLNDSAFIDGFSELLTEDYRLAKSYARDIPTQSLVYVRSFTHKLTSQLGESYGFAFTSPNLYDRIEQLHQAKLIEPAAVRALHRLRSDGNRGAHPEKYHLTQAQLVTVAEKSIEHILRLVTKLYPVVHQHAAPAYTFEPFDSFAGRDLCYRAVMNNDAQAQYLVGMSLKAKGLMLQEQEQALAQTSTDICAPDKADKASTHTTAAEAFAQAGYWFSLASNHYQDAVFEHGVSLLHGYCGEVNLSEGERFIAQAADSGIVDAQALLGFFYLVGSNQFEVDLVQAERLLTLAANAENAEAMSNLGVLYYQAQQFENAFLWVNKAAQAGYPNAQYHLALMLADGLGCSSDLAASGQWMLEAAEQGQVDAMLHCGSHILHDDNASQQQRVKAEGYLHQAIKYGHNVAAMIELSVALADGILGRIDVVQAAYLLTLAKAHANDKQLAVIEPLWQSLAMQIDSVIELNPSDDEMIALQQAKLLLG
ncbi:DUF4145 domain-containing protein [Shewanella inventionis]|uniref:DUF4145 domain-containing protein n=1 Tax=Shewanella inventionis TaxID=1738770 RepID=A0ABQ1IK32_9GAMM|nr:DUF4145 domain-containing protein [Shewanella inventionis]MCL1156374.1 DUF4145 domain-containing protein [Shewanella inventionis]UAL43400.1 DUF4145 domain-containing protein [Shewanella inventionis]GGB45035.1 hypothetical protein GCM10011607_01360 [Shewanella inventionis]